jgi:hypothetical protein
MINNYNIGIHYCDLKSVNKENLNFPCFYQIIFILTISAAQTISLHQVFIYILDLSDIILINFLAVKLFLIFISFIDHQY